jgi:hypothetical protein
VNRIKHAILSFCWSTKILTRPYQPETIDYQPETIDYGYGFVGRRLTDGRYVLERYGKTDAYDLLSPHHKWEPGTVYYRDCIAKNAAALDASVKRVLAIQGI